MLLKNDSEIIVGCAGRTRSIIGTQNLINYGIKNSVKRIFAMSLREKIDKLS